MLANVTQAGGNFGHLYKWLLLNNGKQKFLSIFFPESNNMSLFFNKEKFDLGSFFKKNILHKLSKPAKVNLVYSITTDMY